MGKKKFQEQNNHKEIWTEKINLPNVVHVNLPIQKPEPKQKQKQVITTLPNSEKFKQNIIQDSIKPTKTVQKESPLRTQYDDNPEFYDNYFDNPPSEFYDNYFDNPQSDFEDNYFDNPPSELPKQEPIVEIDYNYVPIEDDLRITNSTDPPKQKPKQKGKWRSKDEIYNEMVKKLERKGIPIPEGATIKQLKDLDKTVKGQSGRPKK